MNYHPNNDWRNRRNLLNRQHIGPMVSFGHTPYSIANYCTDTQHKKAEMKEHFGDDILLNKLHMMSNPLQKNLADTIVTSEHSDIKKMQSKINETDINNMASKMEKTADNTNEFHSTFSGIASFISGVFNVISGSIFHRRTKSEMECFDKEFDVCSHTFNGWQSSNFEDLNKNSLGDDQFSSLNIDISNINHSEMINDCHNAAKQCEDKIGEVRLLLSSGVIPIPQKSNRRRPRWVYVEPSSVEDNFEDACCSEDFNNLPVESYVEHISPCHIQNQELYEIDAEKVKTEAPPVHKSMEVVKNVDLNETTEKKNSQLIIPERTTENVTEPCAVVLSCEEKLNKLKALLNGKQNKLRTFVCTSDSLSDQTLQNSSSKKMKMHKDKSILTPKVKDKRFKNPHKLRTFKKAQLKRNILDDMSFANEIDCDTSGTENSPSIDPILSNEICHTEHLSHKDYFDEISGRFHTSSATESDDSFQIVFTDSPKQRSRQISDCDSEDSFIVFEEPLDCYTSTDVFGDELNDTDSEYSDSESDYSDSECPIVELACKLSHNLSRTVSDLTDDSLYEDRNKFSESIHSDDSEDEINSPKLSCHKTTEAVNFAPEVKDVKEIQTQLSRGLLIDEAKKLQRRKIPSKKVQFSTQPPKVHIMRVWAFAARQARMGHWERHALDRDRFKRRIADVEMAVSWVLKPQHRSRIMFQRFMPWWNAQKRKEIADKKLQEANNLEETNLDDKVNDRPVDSVIINVASNDNINDLVVGIDDKKIKHNLDNKILKDVESDENIPKRVHSDVSNENCHEKYENVDSNSDKTDKNIEAIEACNCATLKNNLKNSEDDFFSNKNIDTVFVNGLNEFNERRQQIPFGDNIESDMNEKRNEIFNKPELISKDNSKFESIKEKNVCNDKLPDTNVGCYINNSLSGI